MAAPTSMVRRWTLPLRARPTLLLAGALMIAGARAGPGGQMVDAEEHAHVDADLGDEGGGDHPVDARDLHQQSVLNAVRCELCFDAVVEGGDILLGRLEPAQLCRQ